jgi:uncharacterized protein
MMQTATPTELPPDTEWLKFGPSGIQGRGAFARRFIPAGTRVIEYVGERIDKKESLRRCELNNEYIFTLDEDHDLDGNIKENPARLINHSCAPNCEARIEEGRIWIVSIRDIPPGQEITFNYGFDLVDYKEYPCRCGSAACVGFMVAEEYFEHVRAQAQVSQTG